MPKKRGILAKESTTKKHQEKLVEKARERMKRLREKRKLQSETDLKDCGSVATSASAKERSSCEKRAAQVRARKMERRREELRKQTEEGKQRMACKIIGRNKNLRTIKQDLNRKKSV